MANSNANSGTATEMAAMPKVVDKVPSSAGKSSTSTRSVLAPDDTDDSEDDVSIVMPVLSFVPIYTKGVITASDMSKMGFLNVNLPSGITDTDQVKDYFNELMTHYVIRVSMPTFLCNSFKLLRDTFPQGGKDLSGKEEVVHQNSRVTAYNKNLDSISHRSGQPVWWKASIKLPLPATSRKPLRKKFLVCEKTNCLVLCLDYVIEDSNFLEEKQGFIKVA